MSINESIELWVSTVSSPLNVVLGGLSDASHGRVQEPYVSQAECKRGPRAKDTHVDQQS